MMLCNVELYGPWSTFRTSCHVRVYAYSHPPNEYLWIAFVAVTCTWANRGPKTQPYSRLLTGL